MFKLSVTDKTRDVSEQSTSRLWTNGKIARMQFKKSQFVSKFVEIPREKKSGKLYIYKIEIIKRKTNIFRRWKLSTS